MFRFINYLFLRIKDTFSVENKDRFNFMYAGKNDRKPIDLTEKEILQKIQAYFNGYKFKSFPYHPSHSGGVTFYQITLIPKTEATKKETEELGNKNKVFFEFNHAGGRIVFGVKDARRDKKRFANYERLFNGFAKSLGLKTDPLQSAEVVVATEKGKTTVYTSEGKFKV